MNLNEIFENYRQAPSERNLAEIIKKSQFLIYSIALNIVKHSQDAEDVTQEVLIKVIQNSNVLPKDVNFNAWLNKVSMNAAINFYHQKKRVVALKNDFQENLINNPDAKEDETISIVYQHISKLEESEQSMIINKHVHQMTFAQLSNLYNMPIPTIQSKINTILSKVKLSVEKAGFASVALALASTLDNLKATEITLDLLPKVKEYFPSTYPKSKPVPSPKTLSKPMVFALGILAVFIIYGGITFINQQNALTTTDFSNQDNSTENLTKKNKEIAKTKALQTNQSEESTNLETVTDNKNIIANTIPTLPIKEDQNSSLSSEYAGQLLDAKTKEPIANAKLEIWDIYTYQKTETTTDIEGKYDIPKELDKTFFYYLKFIKEGYAFKQTFQHFGNNSKPKIYMSKGKKITCKIWFEQVSKGELYFGSYLNLNAENYLTSNQKNNLLKVFNCMLENAPIEVFSYRKVKFENVSDYTISESILEPNSSDFQTSNRDFAFYNFGIWYDGARMKGSYGLEDGGASSSSDHSKNHYKLQFMKTGKPVPVKDLKVVDRHTKREDINNKSNKEIDEYNGPLWNCTLTFKEIDYYSRLGSADFGLEEGQFAIILLAPYSDILFEPLSLGTKFNNSQAIVGGNFFSKKSTFKKAHYASELNVYDNFFEEMQLSTEIKIPIGGAIDINHELNTTLSKNIKIIINYNNKPLKDTWINISMAETEDFDDYAAQKLKLNTNGEIIKMIPLKMKQLKVFFKANTIDYSKIIDLSLVSNDTISIDYSKPLKVQISKEVKAATASADQKEKALFNYSRDVNYLYFSNVSSSIKTPFSDLILFLEKDSEYNLTDSGNSIKTNFNQLKVFKPEMINANIDMIEIKPLPSSDYTTLKVTVTDTNGSALPNANWMVIEDCIANEHNIEYLHRYNSYNSPIEFYNLDDETFDGKDKKLAEDFTIGDEALKNNTVQILNNRKYFLCVSAEGCINSISTFSTFDGQIIRKSIALNKTNSVKFKGETTSEFSEITNILKKDDIIYEYNKVRIIDKNNFSKVQDECNQDSISIKVIRNNASLSLIIPPIQIFGLEDYSYDDKKGLLQNEPPLKTPQ